MNDKSVYRYNDGLAGARLTTRWLQTSDIFKWQHFFDDPESNTYIPVPGETTIDKAAYFINFQLKRYASKRYGLQALIDKNTKQLVGTCGLLLQEVDGKTEIEIGYHLIKQYRGMGYATEAAMLFKEYAFQENKSDSIISIINVHNIPSQKVAERNGLKREKETIYHNQSVYIYRIAKN